MIKLVDSMATTAKQYYLGLDLLKILAAFTVVLIHAPNPHSVQSQGIALRILPPPNAAFALMAGMLMGKLLMPSFNIKPWLKRRAVRLIVPYLIWTGIYVGTNLLFDHLRHVPPMPITDWRWWSRVMLTGAGGVQLWFVAMLIYAQLTVAGTWHSLRRNLAPVGFRVLAGGVGLLAAFGHKFLVPSSVPRLYFFLLGYLLLGLALSQLPQAPWLRRRSGVVAACVVLLLCIVVPLIVQVPAFVAQGLAIINPILWVTAACSLPRHLPGQHWIQPVAGCTMGIYLCHVLVTRSLLLACPFTERFLGPDGFPIYNALIAFAMSLVIVLATHRVKFLWGQ